MMVLEGILISLYNKMGLINETYVLEKKDPDIPYSFLHVIVNQEDTGNNVCYNPGKRLLVDWNQVGMMLLDLQELPVSLFFIISLLWYFV